MYLWKVDNLVEDLKDGAVNQGEQAKYILVNILLLLFISDPLLFIDTRYTFMDTASRGRGQRNRGRGQVCS